MKGDRVTAEESVKGPQISVRTDREAGLVRFFVVEAGEEPGPLDKPAIVVQKAGLNSDPEFFQALQDVLKGHIVRVCDLPEGTKWAVQKVGGEWAS